VRADVGRVTVGLLALQPFVGATSRSRPCKTGALVGATSASRPVLPTSRLQVGAGRRLLQKHWKTGPVRRASISEALVQTTGPDACIDPLRRGCHPTYQRRPDWLATAATGQEHRPQPGPNPAHRPILKPASASTEAHNAPQSPRPRSDNHRSRNLLVTRKPKPNSPLVQEDLRTKPQPLHLTSVRSDQHRQQLPPVKKRFCLLFRRL